MSDGTSTSLVPAGVDPRIAAAVKDGRISDLSALIKAFESAPPPAQIAQPALPAEINEEQKTALARLPEVFGSVVPAERRLVTPVEVDDLLDERSVLKTIEALVKARLDDIAQTVNIHNSVSLEDALAAADKGAGDDPEAKQAARQAVLKEYEAILDSEGNPFYTEKGHVAAKQRIAGEDPSVDEVFSVETRAGKAEMSVARLKALADDTPDANYIDHKDFLSMTRQERVFDPAKAMIAVRSKPELLRAIAEATTTSAPGVSVYVRKKQNGR